MWLNECAWAADGHCSDPTRHGEASCEDSSHWQRGGAAVRDPEQIALLEAHYREERWGEPEGERTFDRCEALNGDDHTACEELSNQNGCEATENADVNGEDCQWRRQRSSGLTNDV